MANPWAIYGPDSEVYNTYAALTSAPGDNGSGGPVAQRGRHRLGTQLVLGGGQRKFRFSLAGGSALVVGNMLTGAAAVSTDINLAAAVGAVGDRIITFTHGAATTAINIFAEGFGWISVTPGFADTYEIASHLALRNATAGDVINLSPGNALRRALTTSSKLDLMRNAYADIIQAAATTIGALPVGVAVSAIPAANFGWIQTKGPVGVLTEGTLVRGNRAVTPTATAGAVGAETAVAATSKIEVTAGFVISLAATTAASLIFLTLDD